MFGLLSLFTGGSLSSKIGLILLIAALAVGVGMVFEIKSLKSDVADRDKQIQALNINNGILTQNVKVLKDNQLVLQQADSVNQQTIDDLKKERADNKNAVDSLAASNLKNQVELNTANKKIQEMIKNPVNDGAVAPVLRETIRDIQTQRSAQ